MSMFRLVVACAAMMVGSSVAIHHLPLVPHHVQKTRRALVPSGLRRRSRGLQQQVGALYQGYGTHYVDMWVGTPPQRQTVIVDTGSGVTAFPCSGCNDCGETHHTDRYFIEAESSTFVHVACDECNRGRCNGSGGDCKIGMSYQEGSSWSAYEGRDMTYIGGPHTEGLEQGSDKKRKEDDIDPSHANRFAFELYFGCQTKLTGLFKTQLADGIMGMDNASSSFWLQAHDAGVIKKKNFSLCFARQPTATREGTEAGALTLGGFDRRLHHDKENGMVYTPMANGRSGFFSVHLRKVYLREGGGGDSAKSSDPSKKILPLNVNEQVLNSGSVIVDSGTTDTYFSRRIASAFNEAWAQFSDMPYSHNPVSLSEEGLNSLPTILVQIEGDPRQNSDLGSDHNSIVGLAGDLDPENPTDIIIAMPPSHYMEWDEKVGKYVARFYTDEGAGSVLGANFMMGHDVNFNVDDGFIGWAESNCDYTKLVNEYGASFEIPEEPVEAEKQEEQQEEEKDDDDNEEEEEGQDDDNEEEKKPTEDDEKSPLDALHAPTSITKAVQSCTDLSCRAGVVAALVGVLMVVFLMVRRIRNRRNRVRYHAAELEVSNLSFHDDDELEDGDEFVRYRDNPAGYQDTVPEDDEEGEESDGDNEGVGYEDEPEQREIA